MTYYGISSDEMEWRRSMLEEDPKRIAMYHLERDKRRSEGVGKGWSYMQEREFNKYFVRLEIWNCFLLICF